MPPNTKAPPRAKKPLALHPDAPIPIPATRPAPKRRRPRKHRPEYIGPRCQAMRGDRICDWPCAQFRPSPWGGAIWLCIPHADAWDTAKNAAEPAANDADADADGGTQFAVIFGDEGEEPTALVGVTLDADMDARVDAVLDAVHEAGDRPSGQWPAFRPSPAPDDGDDGA